jgi:hypothetical protein
MASQRPVDLRPVDWKIDIMRNRWLLENIELPQQSTLNPPRQAGDRWAQIVCFVEEGEKLLCTVQLIFYMQDLRKEACDYLSPSPR